MTKPFSMVVLGKRITALLRRSGVKGEPDIWKHGDLTVDFSRYSACNQNGKIDIIFKEKHCENCLCTTRKTDDGKQRNCIIIKPW